MWVVCLTQLCYFLNSNQQLIINMPGCKQMGTRLFLVLFQYFEMKHMEDKFCPALVPMDF